MGDKLNSRIPELLKDSEARRMFIAGCMMKGMSEYTARKIANGNTDAQASNLAIAASVLQKDFGDLFFVNGGKEQ